MTGREWLRARLLRNKRKTKPSWTPRPAGKPAHLTVDNSEARFTTSSGIITFDGELSEAEADRLRALFRAAIARDAQATSDDTDVAT